MTVNSKRLNYNLEQKGVSLPSSVVKRDGSIVAFDIGRIEKAVNACYGSLSHWPQTPAELVVSSVAAAISGRYQGNIPTVEQVQDAVEFTLQAAQEFEAAKHYILYREEHAKKREMQVPANVREVFKLDEQFFPTQLQQFQFYDKYSRFNWDLMRRETWVETVDRNVDYLRELSEDMLHEEEYEMIRTFILEQKAMPSMRSLAMAGEPALRNSLSIYNCSFMPVIDIDVFVEAMLVSMAGCGVGFSVERENVEQFPRIARQSGGFFEHTVEDSSSGWAESLRFGLRAWFRGMDVEFNYDAVRPAGAPLKIKGGRASGPDPLKFVHDFCRARILSRQGSFLRTIDCHDMMCAVGGAAVSGGVRRTAMISLFSWDDEEMRTCKEGLKLDNNPVRWNANNSAVWPDGLTQIEVIDQMMEMVRGGRGEPGIFSRSNANRTKPARRDEQQFGTNPCGEINLPPFGLCNLSIVVARQEDTLLDLIEKVEIATIIGTIQSMATNFPGMRREWQENCFRERLLGVDITGQQDCPVVQDPAAMEKLKAYAVRTNEIYAKRLGIAQSAAVTCVKPSGNSSQLLNTGSGLHARWAPFYLRRTRVSSATPLFRVLKEAGVSMKPENGQTVDNANTWVVAWPVKAPEGSKTRKDFTAVEQCNYWLLNKEHWTEHNPSVTITYQPEEVLPMVQWVWDHRDRIGGMAFLPADDAQYQQAPYEEITEDQYLAAVAAFPKIDYSLLYAYEHTDMTTAAQELACMSGNCDV